jgi:hypothetical protein
MGLQTGIEPSLAKLLEKSVILPVETMMKGKGMFDNDGIPNIEFPTAISTNGLGYGARPEGSFLVAMTDSVSERGEVTIPGNRTYIIEGLDSINDILYAKVIISGKKIALEDVIGGLEGKYALNAIASSGTPGGLQRKSNAWDMQGLVLAIPVKSQNIVIARGNPAGNGLYGAAVPIGYSNSDNSEIVSSRTTLVILNDKQMNLMNRSETKHGNYQIGTIDGKMTSPSQAAFSGIRGEEFPFDAVIYYGSDSAVGMIDDQFSPSIIGNIPHTGLDIPVYTNDQYFERLIEIAKKIHPKNFNHFVDHHAWMDWFLENAKSPEANDYIRAIRTALIQSHSIIEPNLTEFGIKNPLGDVYSRNADGSIQYDNDGIAKTIPFDISHTFGNCRI